MEGHASVLLLSFVVAFGCWLGVSAWAVVGRVAYDRRERAARESSAPPGVAARGRLRRAAASHRTGRGKWRRISALLTLVHADDPRARFLIGRALVDDDQDVVGVAVRLLGDRRDDWAIGELIETLRDGRYPRSRVATQLDALTPQVGRRLVRLLREPDPIVRFWGATLLARCPDVGAARLIALTRDADANVRAAAVEALGERGDAAALSAVEKRLADDAWFVRVHALRSAGRLGGLAAASAIARALRDQRWWARSAAKDALRDIGLEVAGVVIPYLEDSDQFARNGAAEVLQDVGFVDRLSRHGREGELLERILAAGGPGMREAAARRAAAAAPSSSRELGGLAS